MNRLFPVIALACLFVLAACGSKASAAATTSPTPDRGTAFRNGTSGQLVQINGQTLILTGAAGDTVVAIGSTTTFTKTSVAALADVVPGTCIVATGAKDATGALTAMSVRLSPKAATGCGAGGFGQGPGASPRPAVSPRPGASPRPTPTAPVPMAFVAGEVTAASGTSVTVLTVSNGSQAITVPTTASITTSASVTAADLRTGECVRATGAKDAAGTVQATSIAITPAGPSGSCATGFGGGRGPGRGGAAPTGAAAGA